ncbi:expressed unknown protein [Seminavis robusta]|uniref:Uncharacterized protein n=1 Tax=Seminavis robusta TaxID=568900 RepID=A0A9N8H836_9STRA|nr:expressed unknown protein [Seminavis robusta]|eukprot:Sro147_g067940.1 n/a (434) ;mRNA; r:75009-76310
MSHREEVCFDSDASMSSGSSRYGDDGCVLQGNNDKLGYGATDDAVLTADDLGYGGEEEELPGLEVLGYGEETQAQRKVGSGGGVKASQRLTVQKRQSIFDDHSSHSDLSMFDDSSVDYSSEEEEDDDEKEDLVHDLCDCCTRHSHSSIRSCSISFSHDNLTKAESALKPSRVDLQYDAASHSEGQTPRRISLQFSQQSEDRGVARSRSGCLGVSMGTSRLKRGVSEEQDLHGTLMTSNSFSGRPVRRTTMDHSYRYQSSPSERTPTRGITKNVSSRPSRSASMAHNRVAREHSASSMQRTALASVATQTRRRVTMDMSMSSCSSSSAGQACQRRVSMDLKKSVFARNNPGRVEHQHQSAMKGTALTFVANQTRRRVTMDVSMSSSSSSSAGHMSRRRVSMDLKKSVLPRNNPGRFVDREGNTECPRSQLARTA